MELWDQSTQRNVLKMGRKKDKGCRYSGYKVSGSESQIYVYVYTQRY